MTIPKRTVLAALIAALVALAGCGGDDEGAPIPSQTAQALRQELDGVQARIDNGSAGACRDILEGPRGPNLTRVQELLNSMPDDVDPEVRSALADSFDRLWQLVEQDCEDKAAEEESQQPEPEPEPEPTPPETETVPPPETETTPPDTETTPPEQETLPPEGDGDNDGEIPGEGDGGGVGPGAAKSKGKDKEK